MNRITQTLQKSKYTFGRPMIAVAFISMCLFAILWKMSGQAVIAAPGFERVDALTLNAESSFTSAAVIDTAAGFAYFGTNTSPAAIIKVRLSDFTRVDSLTLNTGENDVQSAVIDPAGGFAYFGTNTSTPIVVKVRLSDFTRVGAITLSGAFLQSAVIDVAGALPISVLPTAAQASLIRYDFRTLRMSELLLRIQRAGLYPQQ